MLHIINFKLCRLFDNLPGLVAICSLVLAAGKAFAAIFLHHN
ncbi:hypothetical protein HMPREF0868_0706 [Mageeibacillus indolicus UPII9-5]|uniref:Uncharacterized protein n=1 Tax=Mageeibacillus indolicus (strain UPII9-5) TaxID=699246 RepID=D3R1G9_MAGIU|nr:hypothetical protein HMPREF0868_0706 [Mageeibacillus indolicus UPII9-5]